MDVLVCVLPVKKIFPRKGMFQAMDNNIQQTKGTVLTNVIFEHFWDQEKLAITIGSFLPFIIYCIFANFYYAQCMFDKSLEAQGVWEQVHEIADIGKSN